MVKIEMSMSIASLVNAIDGLKARGHGYDCIDCSCGTCGSLRFVRLMFEKKLEEVEKVYDDAMILPNEEEVRLFLAGDRIAAIRKLRERVGAGLKQAKDAVERAAVRTAGLGS